MSEKRLPTLDLHGCLAEEVFDLLDPFIRKHQGKDQLRVIVGKGQGIVKKKTIEYLQLTHYSWKYERIRGIDNKGALIVDLF